MLEGDALKDALGPVAIEDISQRIAELARTLIEGRADFLFGAGMSAEADVPAGRAAALGLLRALFTDHVSVPDDELEKLLGLAPLEAIAEAVEYELANSRPSLAERISRILQLDGPQPPLSEAHADFAAVARLGGPIWIRRIFTTNWDDLLEQALGESAQRVTERNTPAYEKALLEGRTPIVYLHGRLDEDFSVTETDIGDTLRLRKVNLILLTRLFEARSFCLVGYSMSDPDLARIYRIYRDQFALRTEHEKLTYVVSPVESSAQYRLLDKIWARRGARFIALTAREFFRHLRYAVQAEASARGVEDLMRGYRWSSEKLAVKRDALKEVFDFKEDEDAYELLRRLITVESGS